MIDRIRFVNAAAYLAIYVALYVAFHDVIFPVYAYMGFKWEPSLAGILAGGATCVAVGLILPPRGDDFRSLMLHILALLPIVPMAVLVGTSGGDPLFFGWTLVGVTAILLASRVRIAISVPVRLSNALGITVLLLITSACIVVAYAAAGTLNFDLDMETVYAIRAEHGAALSGLTEYAHMTATRTLVPLLILAALVYRRWQLVLLGVAFELVLFAITQHRTALFAPFAILLAYWLARRRANVQLVLAGYLGVVLLGWLAEATSIGFFVNEFIVRRVMFVPAMLNFEYYDLVSANQFVYWSDSKLSVGLREYPYAQSVPYVIGEQIGLPGAHANTGWAGSGYMHAGPLGVALYGTLIGLLLSLLNDRAVERGARFGAMAFFILFLWIFMSTDLPAVMLTHGMLIGLVVFHLLNKLRPMAPTSHRLASLELSMPHGAR